MKTIELHPYGVDNALKDLSVCLTQGAHSHSKKEKDYIIYEALGIVKTLYKLIDIADEDDEDEEESKNDESK